MRRRSIQSNVLQQPMASKYDWLPTTEDKAFVKGLMVQVTEPGKMAGWIAPPRKGINDHEIDYEYVKL